MGLRQNYRDLSVEERNRFVQAIYAADRRGIVDRFADIHNWHFNGGIHRTSHFLPWHREMLLRFERELQRYHPGVTIPYWDSSVDRDQWSSEFWAEQNFLGQFNTAWCPFRCLWRSLGASPTLPSPSLVAANQSRDSYTTFWRELEGTIHGAPHNWVGGVMASGHSPRDPVFYLHHGWIDLLWARWQARFPNAPFVASQPGFGVNDPLMEWRDRTPADVLDLRGLGYCYDILRPSLPTGPAAQGDDMQPSELLTPEASIRSPNGLYTFIYQWDGNLVLYGPTRPLWNSGTHGRTPGVCVMQGDGNLVIYGPCWDYIWDSATHDNLGSRLVVQDDGNVVIYRPNGTRVWATNTVQTPVDRVTVPDVREMRRDDASQSIRDAGLVPKLSGSSASNAWVWQQSPMGGANVARGSTVTLSLRTGPIP